MFLVKHLLSNTKLLILALVLLLPVAYFLLRMLLSAGRYTVQHFWIILAGGIALLLAFLVYRGNVSGLSLSGMGGGGAEKEETVAKTLAEQVFPESWKLIQWFRLDADGDGVEEHLLIFRYNYRQGDKKHPDVGPVGGVIYDPINNPTRESPEKTSDLLSGMLLPDVASGKGEGYLAERRVIPRLCKVKGGSPELVIFGYGSDPWPTALSIFRWDGRRYEVLGHWEGDGGVSVSPKELVPEAGTKVGDTPLNCDSPVKSVVVRTRLHDRDLLCKEKIYSRGNAGQRFSSKGPTIGFCHHVPEHPFYPEGAVVAFYETLREKGVQLALDEMK
jgi:hypothetical protein